MSINNNGSLPPVSSQYSNEYTHLQLRIALVEWSPFVFKCAIIHSTIRPIDNCRRPGIYAEYLSAILSLARINYTLHPIVIGMNGTTWGNYVKELDWFDGVLGE
jgi:hypothetical protein